MNKQEAFKWKIGRMQKRFGKVNDRCKNCSHFVIWSGYAKNYFKCEVYGTSNSTATDWRKSYPACGMFNDDSWNGVEMIKVFNATKKEQEEIQVDGQISLFPVE